MKEHFVAGFVGFCIIIGSFSRVHTADFGGSGEVENPEVDESLFEGDIELNEIQEQVLRSGGNMRVSIIGDQYRWPKGIVPYDIGPEFDKEQIRIVKTAMRRISRHTCIKFIERTKEIDYIHFQPGKGCSSRVGRQGHKQNINLKHTCFQEGIVIHEIMHALGFWHEQSRFDRDKFVSVQFDNIHNKSQHNFDQHIKDGDTQGLPYDYDSILHYGEKYFALDKNKQTIVPTGRLPKGVTIGQRDDLSMLDIQRINKLYNCTVYKPEEPKLPWHFPIHHLPVASNLHVVIPAHPYYLLHPLPVKRSFPVVLNPSFFIH